MDIGWWNIQNLEVKHEYERDGWKSKTDHLITQGWSSTNSKSKTSSDQNLVICSSCHLLIRGDEKTCDMLLFDPFLSFPNLKAENIIKVKHGISNELVKGLEMKRHGFEMVDLWARSKKREFDRAICKTCRRWGGDLGISSLSGFAI